MRDLTDVPCLVAGNCNGHKFEIGEVVTPQNLIDKKKGLARGLSRELL